MAQEKRLHDTARTGEKCTESPHSKAETILIEYVYDIKQWLEPYLTNVKNHVYPHSYKFFKKNGKVQMKYKAWARDEKWLPEGNGHHILNGIPEGTPSLVRPDNRKLLEVKQLDDLASKCKWVSSEERQWWKSFTENEKHYWRKWEAALEDLFKSDIKLQWPLRKLKKHHIKVANQRDPDQEAHEQNLEELLQKANHCPNVSLLVPYLTVTSNTTFKALSNK